MSKKNTKGTTQSRLIQAAVSLFGKYGYRQVTTRMLSDHAEVNQAAIPYHFGGKNGVYLKAAEAVAAEISLRTAPLYKSVAMQMRGGVSKDECAKLTALFVATMIKNLVGPAENKDSVRFVFREYLEPGEGFHIIYESVIARNHMALTSLVACLLNSDPESDEAIIRGHAVAGQVFGMVSARATLLKRLGREEYTEEDIQLMQRIVVENTLRSSRVSESVIEIILADSVVFSPQKTEGE